MKNCDPTTLNQIAEVVTLAVVAGVGIGLRALFTKLGINTEKTDAIQREVVPSPRRK